MIFRVCSSLYLAPQHRVIRPRDPPFYGLPFLMMRPTGNDVPSHRINVPLACIPLHNDGGIPHTLHAMPARRTGMLGRIGVFRSKVKKLKPWWVAGLFDFRVVPEVKL